ncbi:hypothetical protein E3N88_09396 [Mikania micrantha]|uniref:Uncharacterized protein n=1 Tax=Mikania micrantha TaxID=192012 RepID=A0A5N6PIX4_9ASTR|nr:hypothetical protein E3N88_09396 [Mikania micrantha]
METCVKKVISSLETDSEDDVRMVGISGTSCFDHISFWFDFEGKIFVENVREVSKGSSSGLKKLQKLVHKDVLNDQRIDVGSVSDRIKKMKKMMPGRKALSILKDEVIRVEARQTPPPTVLVAPAAPISSASTTHNPPTDQSFSNRGRGRGRHQHFRGRGGRGRGSGHKLEYLTQNHKETSSRLGEDGPGNKKRRKLDFGICRATRRPLETLSSYATGGKDECKG